MPNPSRSLALAAALALITSVAAAQQPDPVRVTFSLDPAEAAPGATVRVRAEVVVERGWHIYGTQETNGVPTELKVEAPAGLTAAGGVQEPAPEQEEMQYVGTISIHRGEFQLSQGLTLAAGAGGQLSVPVSLTYQACSEGLNSVCLEPRTQSAELSLNVGGASSGGNVGQSEELSDVAAQATLEPARVRPGDAVLLHVDLRLPHEVHVYGTETPNGLPTSLALELPTGLTAEGGLSESPAASAEEIELFGKVNIHHERVRFSQRVRVAADATPGTLGLKGVLNWQACDAASCWTGEQAFDLPLEVSPDAPVSGVDGTARAGSPQPAKAAGKAPLGTLSLALASVVMGLFMLLMPCTYPMIPITISIFSKGKSLSRAATFARAGTYAAGIVVSFVVLGGVVQVVVGGSGQGAINALATNAWVNLAIGGIFVYFALSFFGYYELGIPAPLYRLMQLGSAKQDADGTVPTWSLFLMGLFFVLTSYTCGAPVVLGLFATAAQAPHPMAIIFATFVFALTVAAPFFLLALIPSGMRLMPKSGSWFSVFKVVLAFVELGFAIKFFRGTDLQWEFLDLFTRPVTLALWVGLAAASALYLHGYFPLKFPHDPDLKQWSPRRYAWGWLFVGLAAYFGWGLAGNELNANVEAFILPDEEHSEDGTIDFGLPYGTSLEALEEAKQAGPRSFLLFTGHNCVNCVQMEKGVLPRPAVKERLEQVGRVALFTDKADSEAEQAHKTLMLEKYNAYGTIPCFFVIDAQGEVLSAQIGSCSEEDFVAFLEAGGL